MHICARVLAVFKMSTIKNLQAFYSGNLQAFIVLRRPEETR